MSSSTNNIENGLRRSKRLSANPKSGTDSPKVKSVGNRIGPTKKQPLKTDQPNRTKPKIDQQKGTKSNLDSPKRTKSKASKLHLNKNKGNSEIQEIINNPGLQHITEAILSNLTTNEAIEACESIHSSTKQILENPMFWLKKWIQRGLSKEFHAGWIKAIQMTKSTELENNLIPYMKRMCLCFCDRPSYYYQQNPEKYCNCNIRFVDIPCYIDQNVVKKLRNSKQSHLQLFSSALKGALKQKQFEKWKVPKNNKASQQTDMGMIQILAPILWTETNIEDKLFMDNETYYSSYHYAVDVGHVDIIKILAPLTEDPNFSWPHPKCLHGLDDCDEDEDDIAEALGEYVPIYLAAKNGHTEIVKILAPMINDPNPSVFINREYDKVGRCTPIHIAAVNGHADVIEILAPLVGNLEADEEGRINERGTLLNGNGFPYTITPIESACREGHENVVKVFQSFGIQCTCKEDGKHDIEAVHFVWPYTTRIMKWW